MELLWRFCGVTVAFLWSYCGVSVEFLCGNSTHFFVEICEIFHEFSGISWNSTQYLRKSGTILFEKYYQSLKFSTIAFGKSTVLPCIGLEIF